MNIPAWVVMWTLSIAIFAAFKVWVYARARAEGLRLSAPRMTAYWLWPGMDPASFAACVAAQSVHAREAFAALLKTIVGAVLFWGLARQLENPLAAGWCGMLGLVLMLHFGSFHILSLTWRAFGIDAEPIMRAPLLATSLGDFWGNRWNLAFRQLGYELVFRPFHRTLGVAGATAMIFLLSGAIHDLVISIPAQGGYGLPTLYFVIQGAGVLAEKSDIGRRLGLGRGVRGRLFAIGVAAAPAFWLFHPPFVERVMIPFMQAVGALGGY